jgi:hypothetical protein
LDKEKEEHGRMGFGQKKTSREIKNRQRQRRRKFKTNNSLLVVTHEPNRRKPFIFLLFLLFLLPLHVCFRTPDLQTQILRRRDRSVVIIRTTASKQVIALLACEREGSSGSTWLSSSAPRGWKSEFKVCYWENGFCRSAAVDSPNSHSLSRY